MTRELLRLFFTEYLMVSLIFLWDLQQWAFYWCSDSYLSNKVSFLWAVSVSV